MPCSPSRSPPEHLTVAEPVTAPFLLPLGLAARPSPHPPPASTPASLRDWVLPNTMVSGQAHENLPHNPEGEDSRATPWMRLPPWFLLEDLSTAAGTIGAGTSGSSAAIVSVSSLANLAPELKSRL